MRTLTQDRRHGALYVGSEGREKHKHKHKHKHVVATHRVSLSNPHHKLGLADTAEQHTKLGTAYTVEQYIT